MEAFETFEHAGFTVELHQDYDSGGPGEWDNLGALFAFESKDELNGFADRSDSIGQSLEAWDRERPGFTVRYLRACGYHAVLFRYEDYGSSGARVVALDDDEDVRATGYIACSFERMREEGPVDGDWRRALVGELANWDAWVEGRVAGYVIREAVTSSIGANVGAVVGSCWGFYPDETGDGLDYVREEARNDAEGLRDQRIARAEARQLGWALARVARPRLEYLRGELRAERISYGELAELQGLAPHIEPGDVELLEAAGVPEFADESC